jgi:hypothetical protein
MPTGLLEAVTDAPWGEVSQKDYDIAQWRRASLIGPAEQTDVKGDYHLQVRMPNGDLSRGGCHAAAARINQVDAPAADVKAAAKKLVGLYRDQLDEEPPESLLALAGMAKESRRLHESTPLVEARSGTATGRRMRIKVITPGWGSSGYYGPPVLEQVGKDRLIPAGTHMYLDHPTETEEVERPERSVRDLAAVTVTTAVWDPDQRALMAEAQVFGSFQDLLAEQAPHIGVSIRAAGLAEQGEAEGRTGTIITRITEVMSVDFVTAAGRGGEIVALLESARGRRIEEARNIGAWLEARIHSAFTEMADRMYGEGRLTRDERICLSSAVGDALGAFAKRVEADAPHLFTRDIFDEPGEQATAVAEAMPGGLTYQALQQALGDQVTDAYGGKDIWTWVHDFTDAYAVFRVECPDGAALYRQPYAVTDKGAVALTGQRVEVRANTTYEPVKATESTPAAGATSSGGPGTHPPASPGGAGHQPSTSREGAARMAEIPDTELASLREAASRTLTAEAALAEATKNLSEARAQVEGVGRNAERLVEAERLERAAVAEARRLKAVIDAGPVIDKALTESELPAALWPEVRSLVTGEAGRAIPLTEAGAVDTDALDVAVTAAIDTKRATYARVLEATGAGTVRGLGESAGDLTDITADLEREFRDFGLTEAEAKSAAGRG